MPRGARYGSLIHDLLEWQTQQGWPLVKPHGAAGSSIAQAWQQWLDRKTRGLNLPARSVQALPEALREVLSTPLPLGGPGASTPSLVLSQIGEAQRWPEMEFKFVASDVSSARIDQWITEQVLPGQTRAPLENGR